MVFFCRSQKFFRFWPKTMDCSQWFDFRTTKKVLKNVYHLKGNEKRNLIVLVSVAWHFRVGSYERLIFFKSATVTTFTIHIHLK